MGGERMIDLILVACLIIGIVLFFGSQIFFENTDFEMLLLFIGFGFISVGLRNGTVIDL